MDQIVIEGGHTLAGETFVHGAKNAALPLMFSSLLAEGTHVFSNVPPLMDIGSAQELLGELGCECHYNEGRMTIQAKSVNEPLARYDLVRKMRASILVLGPLLAKYKKAQVSLPGGCAIGTRPIDIHLDALEQMGAEIKVDQGYVFASTEGLKGANLLFDSPSVGATENLMMAACLAEGETLIENAAKEPEIVDLATYLNKMGAKIKGAGTSIIRIEGVDQLEPSEHEVIPDRIEAGTLLIAAAISGGELVLRNCEPLHLEALVRCMSESGFRVDVEKNTMTLWRSQAWRGVDVTTSPHPGFPTDLQAQFMALMTVAEGTSVISETVFENRFMHVQELVRMNADITPKTRVAVVRGNGRASLVGAPVMATDLRASACLVLAGLAAQGETQVNRIYHLDRGYHRLAERLASLGAKVKRVRPS